MNSSRPPPRTVRSDLFAHEQPLCCFVLLPPDEAPAVALTVTESGCHVFIEKHGANSSAALREVAAAAEARGVQTACGYLWRNHPLTRETQRLLREGVLGEVWAWEARIITTSIADRLAGAATSQGAVAPVGGAPWLFERARSGGGILFWLASHYLDWILFVLQQDVVEVSAILARRTDAFADVEDVASVSLRMREGAIGTVHAGYITPAGFRHKDDGYWALQGTRGDLRWSPSQRKMTVRSNHAVWSAEPEREYVYDADTGIGYGGFNGQDFFRDILQAFATNCPPLVTLRDAARVLTVFEAAYQSAATGRTVAVIPE